MLHNYRGFKMWNIHSSLRKFVFTIHQLSFIFPPSILSFLTIVIISYFFPDFVETFKTILNKNNSNIHHFLKSFYCCEIFLSLNPSTQCVVFVYENMTSSLSNSRWTFVRGISQMWFAGATMRWQDGQMDGRMSG